MQATIDWHYSILSHQIRISIIRVRMGYKNPTLEITVCHHSASLVMPIRDPRDGLFYPMPSLMMYSYTLAPDRGFHYSYEDGIENPSLAIAICRHSASLVMPIGDPRDGLFYPTLTLMVDSYYNPRHVYLQISQFSLHTRGKFKFSFFFCEFL